jgi:polysaccharide export outer membrane protein
LAAEAACRDRMRPAISLIRGHRRAVAVACGAGAVLVLSSCASQQANTAAPIGTPETQTVAPAASQPAASMATADLNRAITAQLSPPTNEADLTLGVGDFIEISVVDVPELDRKLRIPHSGRVTLPHLGAIQAAGLSALELESVIRTQLREKYMHNPQVSVFVHEHKSQRISVIGAVRTGGVFTITSRLRLADALAMAGGLTEDAGHVVYVVRRPPADGGTDGPPKANADGAEQTPSVQGAGQSPQRAVQSAGPSSPAAVQGAGPSPQPAVRGAGQSPQQVMTAIDLQGLANGHPELNLRLEAGDVIEIPRAGTYYVGGEVLRAGSYPLKSRTTVKQATVVAGGMNKYADHDDIRLYRVRPDGQREIFKYSFNDFEKGGVAPDVQAHDVILVGKSGGKTVFYMITDFVRFGIGASIPP